MKRFLTLILSVIMVMSMLVIPGMPAFAEEDENLALGKPISAKSSRDGYDPKVVNDGDRNNMWAGNSGVDGNWVMVDLEDAYILTSVIIQPRKDADVAYYRGNIHVQISNTPDFTNYETIYSNTYMSSGVSENIPPFGEPVEIKLTSKTPYRYVRAIRMDANTFGLNEIEVYGYQFDPNSVSVGADAVGTELEGPITLMRYLNLIELKDPLNDFFGVSTLLSRAEAADMLVKAFSGNVSFSGGIPFTDVNKSHPYYQSIVTACHLGFVSGDSDTQFRPDEYINMTEFMFMTLRAMGYEDVVPKVLNNNPGQVINVAKELHLDKNVNFKSFDDPVTRGNAVMVFYNALLAPSLKMNASEQQYLIFGEGEDLLRRNHSIELHQGVVQETCITALDGALKTRKNTAKIGGQSFVDTEGKLNAYLGKEVVIATSLDNPESILLAWPTGRDEEVVLPAKDLASSEADIHAKQIVAYDAEGNKESYHLDYPYYVVKNGVVDPYYLDKVTTLLRPSNGQIRLLDNDRDGYYEVAFVEEYTLHYLEAAYYDTNELTFIDHAGQTKVFDLESLTLIGADGGSVAVKNLVPGSVIKLFSAGGKENAKIALYNEPVVGKVNTLSDESVSIGNTSYSLSDAYVNLSNPTPGEPVSAYVDEAGEVIWIERDEDAINAGWTTAFSQKIAIGQGMNPAVGFRFFTESGTWEELYVADKVMVDGAGLEKSKLIDLLKQSSSGRFTDTIVRYKKDNSGQIKEIDTVKSGDTFVQAENISPDAIYTTGSEAFWLGYEQTPAKRTTIVFDVPKVGGVIPKDTSSDSSYKVKRLDQVVPSHTANKLSITPFMLKDEAYPVCFMKYTTTAAASGSETFISSTGAPFLLVENVVRTANEDGAVVLQITGQNITNTGITGEAKIYVDVDLKMIESGLLYQNESACFLPVEKNESAGLIDTAKFNELKDSAQYKKSVSEIGFGDIIRYQPGSPTVYAIERAFDYQTSLPVKGNNPHAIWYSAGKNYGYYQVYYRYQFGQVEKIDKETITFNTLYGEEEIYLKTAYSSIYVCETVGKTKKITKVNDLGRYVGGSYKAMLYSYNGTPRAVIIYPY